MIILYDAKIMEVDKDWHEIMRTPQGTNLEFTRDGMPEVQDVDSIKELINGVRFLRPGADPEDIFVGCDKSISDLLGLQFESWENLNQELCRYQDRAMESESDYRRLVKDFRVLRNKVTRFNNAPWWRRLWRLKL